MRRRSPNVRWAGARPRRADGPPRSTRKAFLGGVIAAVSVAAGLAGIYGVVSVATAPHHASFTDLHFSTSPPPDFPPESSYLFAPGSELVDLYGGCTTDKLKALASVGKVVDPQLQVTLTNAFVGDNAGQLYLNNLRAETVESSPSVTMSTVEECPTEGVGSEAEVTADVDASPRFERVIISAEDPEHSSGEPTFTLVPGETISFVAKLTARSHDHRVKLVATLRNGAGSSWDVDLLGAGKTVYVPGLDGVVLKTKPEMNSPNISHNFVTADDLGVHGEGYATVTVAPSSADDLSQIVATLQDSSE